MPKNFIEKYIVINTLQYRRKDGKICIFIDGFNMGVIAHHASLTRGFYLLSMTFNKMDFKLFTNEIIFHSDHGAEYLSTEYQEMLKKNQITQSLSAVGNSLDNRPSEYLFNILKTEHLSSSKFTLSELLREIDVFIKFYNEERFQTNLDNLTPKEFKERYLNSEKFNNPFDGVKKIFQIVKIK